MKRNHRFFSVLALLIVISTLLSLAQETKDVQKSGPFNQKGRLYVDTYKGSIDILPWDKSEIDIHATIEADGDDRYSREQVQDTEIRIDLSASSARVKTDYDRANRRHHGFLGLFNENSNNQPLVHYTIKVPRSTSVVIKDYKSRTTMDGLQADAEIETYKGEVRIGKLSGSLDLKTYKGEARIGFASLGEKSRVETYKGEIEISVPRGKGFDLQADIGKHARLKSDFQKVRDRDYDRHRSSDIRSSINGGGPLLRIKSDHGEIRLFED